MVSITYIPTSKSGETGRISKKEIEQNLLQGLFTLSLRIQILRGSLFWPTSFFYQKISIQFIKEIHVMQLFRADNTILPLKHETALLWFMWTFLRHAFRSCFPINSIYLLHCAIVWKITSHFPSTAVVQHLGNWRGSTDIAV